MLVPNVCMFLAACKVVLSSTGRMEKEIDMIIAQQKELEELLVPLEGEVSTRQLRHGQTTDSERERMYVC